MRVSGATQRRWACICTAIATMVSLTLLLPFHCCLSCDAGGAIRDGVSSVSCLTPSTSPNHCKEAHCATAYIVLFAITAVYFLLSGLFVRRIRGVK